MRSPRTWAGAGGTFCPILQGALGGEPRFEGFVVDFGGVSVMVDSILSRRHLCCSPRVSSFESEGQEGHSLHSILVFYDGSGKKDAGGMWPEEVSAGSRLGVRKFILEERAKNE